MARFRYSLTVRKASIRYHLAIIRALLRYIFSLRFVRCLRNSDAEFRFGNYLRHNGDAIPYFFVIQELPLSKCTIGGLPILESLQAERVRTVWGDLQNQRTGEVTVLGRSATRVRELIEARISGTDDFVLLVDFIGRDTFEIDDGATRACVLALSGEESVRAVIAAWL